jgi:hypothetical protein
MIAAIALAAAVQIQATDFALSMPAHIPAGLTRVAFENKGHEPHYVRFVRIAAGHTHDDFVAWQKAGGAIPDWLVSAGGVGTVSPGMTEELTLTLAAGSYVALCTYPSPDGVPHLRKGMYAPFEAGPAASPEKAPDSDLTLTLHDHGFQLNAPVSSGKPVWHVRNNGSEPHQALIVRLPEDANEWQERLWFNNGARGPRRGVPVGGVIEIAPQADAWFAVDLASGKYILLCTIQEQEGRHFDLGMIYRFTIE